MISCLTDYINLKDVGTTAPKSGRFLNELPGVDTTKFDLVRDEEVYDIETAWLDIQRRAQNRFEAKLNTWGAKYFKNYNSVENVVTGQYDNNTAVPAATNLRGWKFGSFLTTHKNINLILQYAELYSDAAVSSSIFVYNSSNGNLLDQIDFTFTANKINRIFLNKEYPIHKYPDLFVCYDDQVIVSLQASNNGLGAITNTSQGAISNSASILKGNIGGVGTTGQGLILSYSLSCAWDNFVCQRIKQFEESYMYLLGAEFCNEVKFSDRINQYTLLKEQEALDLKDYFNTSYE